MEVTALALEHMWKHAFGPDWQKHVNKDRIISWFKKNVTQPPHPPEGG